MSRKINSQVLKATPPLRDPAEPGMRPGDCTFDSHIEARRGAPYQVGDVLRTLHNGKSKRALVYAVQTERTLAGDVRCCWLVRVETAAGRWADNWIRVYPGDVERGFAAAPSSVIRLATGVDQDGGQFYLTIGDATTLLADYSDLVAGDGDLEGAQLARKRFADEFPEHAFVERSEARQ